MVVFSFTMTRILQADITRSWMGAGDDAMNSYGIPPFDYKENEGVLEVIKRVIITPRFLEVGSNHYIKNWVFLVNNKPVGYVMHTTNEIRIRALTRLIPLTKDGETTEFHFESMLNENVEKYLRKHGIMMEMSTKSRPWWFFNSKT